MFLICLALLWAIYPAQAKNSTFYSSILPGFSPDPSYVFAPTLDNTTVCVTSSFLTFPGLPISASRNLHERLLVSYALNREEQLSEFSMPNLETGGIWARKSRNRDGAFYLVAILVLGSVPSGEPSR